MLYTFLPLTLSADGRRESRASNLSPSMLLSTMNHLMSASTCVIHSMQTALPQTFAVKETSSTGRAAAHPAHMGGMQPGPAYVPAPAFHSIFPQISIVFELPFPPPETTW